LTAGSFCPLIYNQPVWPSNREGKRMKTSVRISCSRAIAIVILCFAHSGAFAETPQEHVHRMSHHVMPFDMSKTVHIFKMTETGGVQRVVATDPHDRDKVTLIRQHLEQEAEKFQRGDFSDPARLHGADMPGLPELRANASRVEISYSEIPTGAGIVFKTNNLRLLTAIHRWFGAQLSEHGTDARAE
jgi:hypothetical protein